MYHSPFYEMLYRINAEPAWRSILRWPSPDLHMKDIEILLRAFAMLIKGTNYAPSMVKFLNQFSKKCEAHSVEQNDYLRELFTSFLDACEGLPEDAFINKKTKRFNIALLEAVFTAACKKALAERRILDGTVRGDALATLENDEEFLTASLEGTTRTANVELRLSRAEALIDAL